MGVRAEDSVPVQSLPSGLVFAGDVPGTNRQQYLRNNVVAQTLPRPITFASEEESENFVLLTPRKETRPGPVARQPFLRSGERDLAFYPAIQTPGGLVGLQTLPSQTLQASDQDSSPHTVKLSPTSNMRDPKMCYTSLNEGIDPELVNLQLSNILGYH